jgi:hypothetical protein
VAPGGQYGIDGPLLMYAKLAVSRRSGSTLSVRWELSGGTDSAEHRKQVAAQVAAAIDELTAATGTAPVVIAKSLASFAAPVVADRGLAAIWFTPLLSDEPTAAALRRATGPFLLAGGTADDFWDGQTARSLTPHVVEIEDADHGLFVPGELSRSAAVLGQVMTAVEDFLDRIVWP